MTDRAMIARYTETSTSDGVEHAWTEIASGVPCAAWPSGVSGNEGLGTGGAVVRALSTWTVRLPALFDVTERDRITVTGPSYPDGTTLEVQRVDARTAEAARDCICELVT